MATKLKRLQLNEVSLVDKGANQHAHITLFKRDDEAAEPTDADVEAYLKRKFSAGERRSDAKSGAAMRDGSFPIENKGDLKNAIRAYGRAKNKDAAKRHIISRARALGATSMLPDGWVSKAADGDTTVSQQIEDATAALAKSVSEIISGEAADVPAALEATFKQYNEHVSDIAKDMYDVSRFADMISSAAYLARSSQMEANAEGDGSQVPAKLRNWVQQGAQVFQQMASEEVNELIAMANDVSKRGGETAPDKEPDMTEIEKKLAEVTEALAKANKELAFAKMSDGHKAYATEQKLEGEALDGFVAKSAEDRDAHIKANPVEKKVNPEVELAKREAADLRKRLEAVEETNAKIEFAKKATELGLAETDGEALRKAYAGDKAGVDRLAAVIKGLTEQVKTGKLFEEFGVQKGADTTSPKSRVDAVVAEMQAVDKSLTRAKAIEKIASDPKHSQLWADYKAA